jgi:hypothetical protein
MPVVVGFKGGKSQLVCGASRVRSETKTPMIEMTFRDPRDGLGFGRGLRRVPRVETAHRARRIRGVAGRTSVQHNLLHLIAQRGDVRALRGVGQREDLVAQLYARVDLLVLLGESRLLDLHLLFAHGALGPALPRARLQRVVE